jgi:hypothetical protein
MTAPHDRPDPLELMRTVREFLEQDVTPTTTGQIAFHTRVAINALKIAERELMVAEEDMDTHRKRLARLGVGDDAEFAAAIRAGQLDGRLDEVATAAREVVWAKIIVANPKYRLPYTSPQTAREQMR